MFIIINYWYDYTNLSIVCDDCGDPLIFNDYEEAMKYTEKLNGESVIVCL